MVRADLSRGLRFANLPLGRPHIIAARKHLLEPQIQDYEQIAASHLLDLELGDTGLPVSPGDRNHRKGEASDDGLQRHFNREIEMRRDERLHELDRFAAVTLERVRNVVVAEAEYYLHEPVRQLIDDHLLHWIAEDLSTRPEPRS